MSQDELSKREEDRINRTLNNVGRRGPRPVSWNVPQTQSLAGPLGSIGRKDGAAGLKTIQEQIREEERRQQAQAQQAQLDKAQHAPSPTPSSQQTNFNGAAALGGVEDEAEKDRKMRVEEERLERWMRKGDTRFDENKSSDPRRRSISIDSYGFPEHLAAANTAATAGSKIAELAVKFQDQIYQASKAIRQKKTDEVVKHGFSVSITAKAIADNFSNDAEIFGHAKLLEEAVSLLRADSTIEANHNYDDVANSLGRIFISTIGLL